MIVRYSLPSYELAVGDEYRDFGFNATGFWDAGQADANS
jgi:hypothetical protein